jgi:hypothetical protein
VFRWHSMPLVPDAEYRGFGHLVTRRRDGVLSDSPGICQERHHDDVIRVLRGALGYTEVLDFIGFSEW